MFQNFSANIQINILERIEDDNLTSDDKVELERIFYTRKFKEIQTA
ncbi:hypothetical protein C7459_11233 [Tumebacillus permanentifrigoris]|uniref:Uncharacterized protein n=1 Tax=Tumebacillus permanentifrigoris TaxID=378543 RepID=A0A316DAM4_9BACL|nr:hypothetical protein C7459_11233 [Tumebacillus permanentifrigoris]